MKVATTSDWRDGIPFGVPVVVADVIPGEPTRCSVCGGDSELRSRSDLWAFKHRHPHHHDGYVRFYCREHLPKVERREAPVATHRPGRAPRGERAPATPRSAPVAERQRAMCPNCFIEVAAAGVCGVCGWRPDA